MKNLILLLLAISTSFSYSLDSVEAKKIKTKKIKASKKHQVIDMDSRIPRTKFDSDIDEMIFNILGKHYRRANIYDLYPLEIPKKKSKFMGHKEKVALMDYYNYSRKDIERISQSKLLKVIKMNFDLNHGYDYAIIVRNTKKSKNALAIINFKEKLYLDDFNADFIEKVNQGKYPTTVVYANNKRKVLQCPSIRLVAFDNDSKILYYDKKRKNWETISLN